MKRADGEGIAEIGAVFAPAQTQSEIDQVERSAQDSLLEERNRRAGSASFERESLLCVQA